MLSCKDVAERGSALIDGELSGWDRFRMRLHLAMCKRCSRFILQMRITERLTARAADLDGPPGPRAEDSQFGAALAQLRKERLRR